MKSEFYGLFRDSKLAQVAKPLGKQLRGSSKAPTHQIIYTPKSSAIRSNFGLKTALPKQYGFSHIVYNDIDNRKNLPDVEKYSGSLHNRLKFQEMDLPIKTYYTESNPLFPSKSTRSKTSMYSASGNVLAGLNLTNSAASAKVQAVLKQNPQLYQEFHKFLVQNHPDAIVSRVPTNVSKLLKQFLQSDKVKKHQVALVDKESPKTNEKIQGTGGFSYLQKGRITNTPNGLKYGVVAPGRLIGDREAAVGGFVATFNDRVMSMQRNYTKNYPGKHQRQFVLPFKVNEAEITETGRVKLFADGVKTGSWTRNNAQNSSSYQGSNYDIKGAGERNTRHNVPLESLLNLIGGSK